jgi:hypothetical protein
MDTKIISGERNTIADDQNTDQMLKYLAAQRNLYSRAKFVMWLQLFFVILLAVVLSLLGAAFPQFAKWAALYGITVAITDAAIIETQKKSLQRHAATIQEIFDSEVLKLEWNQFEVGLRPDVELINEAANKFFKKHQTWNDLRDWYPPAVKDLPLHLARLVCQRSNCWFDRHLRMRFSQIIVVALLVPALVVLVISLSTGLNVERLVIAILAPLLPFILWTIREYRNQRQAVDTLNRLRNVISDLWQQALHEHLDEKRCAQESRRLQDGIFAHRSTSPLVFDFVYTLLRKQSEETINRSAEDLVAEALKTLDGNTKSS